MFCEVPPRVQVRGGVCVPETDSGFVLAEQKFPGGVVHASGEMFADACDKCIFDWYLLSEQLVVYNKNILVFFS